jgi:CRISPR/Cas system Type II protein with McrA/HNH and RuvC-like nuclease domain
MVNGAWVCKYSGVAIPESRLVDIDHIVPIKYTFDITNGSFTSAKKHAFAVDDSNLVSVSQHENRSKGDAGLSGYMPQQNGCFYLSHWRYMVKKYKLHLPAQDSAILAKGLKICKL